MNNRVEGVEFQRGSERQYLTFTTAPGPLSLLRTCPNSSEFIQIYPKSSPNKSHFSPPYKIDPDRRLTIRSDLEISTKSICRPLLGSNLIAAYFQTQKCHLVKRRNILNPPPLLPISFNSNWHLIESVQIPTHPNIIEVS